MSFTPPVSRDGFAYAIDSFYAESSNSNRHRRATIPELNALFHPSSAASHTAEKEPVGHWYEAQLMHYGLAPSKNKAVAKTRLLDAVNKGTLAVPAHIKKVEEELRKEWLKNDKGTKKGTRDQKAGSTAANVKKTEDEPPKDTAGNSRPAPKAKRKKNEQEPLDAADVRLPPNAVVKGAASADRGMPTKRAKTTARGGPVSVRPNKAKTDAPKKSEAPKPEILTSASGLVDTTVHKRGSAVSGRARGGGSLRGKANNQGKPVPATSTAPPRTKQTARRSGGWLLARNMPSFREEDSQIEGDPYYFKGEESENHELDSPGASSPGTGLPPLGLINGLYSIRSSDLDQWPEMYEEDEFDLILCLDGGIVWGAYDFGMHSGIMRLPRRPAHSSHTPVAFSWRGRENGEGEMSFGPDRRGWIRFLGRGRIEGMINCFGDAKFTGQRVSGDETRAPRSAMSMRDEWEDYNEDAYERERVGRWG